MEVESGVYVLWVNRSLTCEKWIMNFNRHLIVWEIVWDLMNYVY